jgi:transposase
MGPEAAKSWPGQRLLVTAPAEEPPPRAAGRARQEIDYGRREKGYLFGAFCPATGDAYTAPYQGRTIANWVDFLERVDGWLPVAGERVYAVLDNLSTHRAVDVLLFQLTHPRWEFVFQPTYAADLNLIEPWWKILRSLALKGRRFATWAEIAQAVEAATAYWQAHKHPFIWGKRRRHRLSRQPGIALRPIVT